MTRESFLTSRATWILAALLIITFVPFLGETLFNTKGEPREAIVAVSMLQSGDWILPVSNGGDIPYKPPMFAWIIAAVSWLNGGSVTEMTSRLPSALAMIVMTMTVYGVMRRHTAQSVSFMTAIVLATSFEVHRAACNCRVDMVLTMFMVCSVMLMYDRVVRGKTPLEPVTVLLLSGGVMTKGPVGAVLPLAVIWAYMLFQRWPIVRTTLSCLITGLLSLVLPAVWYWLAYRQGGEEFYRLVMEENFGRLTGTMSYESHVNPWWYNLVTLLSGMLPYTLLAVASLFAVRYRAVPGGLKTAWNRFRNSDSLTMFMILSLAVVFIFYCIPSSKRSVYLLPVYPSLAYFTVLLARRLYRLSPGVLKIYASIMATVAITAALAYVSIIIFKPEFGGRSTKLLLEGLACRNAGLTGVVTISLATAMALFTLRAVFCGTGRAAFRRVVVMTLLLYWSFSSVYQPGVLNSKSNRGLAAELAEEGYGEEIPLYGWCSDRLIRFYTINFYLGDKVRAIQAPPPCKAVTLVGERDLEEWNRRFGDRFEARLIRNTGIRSCDIRQNIMLVETCPN